MRVKSFLLTFWSLFALCCSDNRFGSFAPSRSKCNAAWYIDGEDYMAAVADAIEIASNDIFIADWQFSPYIYMKRPETGVDSYKWRLDKMLLRKANVGVKIYILLYAEPPKFIVDLGSEIAQQTLKHPNIKVLLRPDVYDVIRHIFTLRRWTHHEKLVVVDQSIAFIGGIDLSFGFWDNAKHELTDNHPVHPCLKNEGYLCDKPQHDQSITKERKTWQRWVGKDYGNFIQGGDRIELDRPLEDYMDRTKIPRMPWHDVGCAFTGRPASDVAKHFIQRYNAFSPNGNKLQLSNYNGLLEFIPSASNRNHRNLKIQVLRSVDKWSADQNLEHSIYNAYLHSIENAKHFIYIENQLFISSPSDGVFEEVKNQIQSTLTGRILRAFEDNQNFHVMIVITLQLEIPGFAGNYGEESGKFLEEETYWINLSINTLYEKLEEGGIPKEEIHNYLSIYGLRTHGILNGEVVTEIIYVHSKVMIVDDQITIIGSANINDRSMLGSRDSEIAVIVEDTDMIRSTMDGKSFQVGKFSHGLRCNLMKEHLGLLDGGKWTENVEDPLKKNFIQKVSDIADVNDIVFNHVFGGSITPKDDVKNYEQLKEWRATTGLPTEQAREELKKICGRLVPYPRNFLEEVLKSSSIFAMTGMYTSQ